MNTWDSMNNWDLVLPPSRPSKSQLDWISSHIRKIDKAQPVAVLGSTPEFRDHLYELGFENIHIFDKNLTFFQRMSDARIYHNEEVFVYGDWLDTLAGYSSRFAVILSDLTSGNIAYIDRVNFYGLITNALMNSGVFLDKVLTHPGAHLTVDEIVEKYAHLPLNLMYINYFSCEMLFCSELLDFDFTVDTTRFYELLEKKIGNPRIKAFVHHAQSITPRDCLWYYGKRWSELDKEYCQGTKRIDEKDDAPSSPYFGRVKLLVHQRI